MWSIFPSVPGSLSQAKTLDDLNIRMKEVLELCLETMSEKKETKSLNLLALSKYQLLYKQTSDN